MSAEAPGSAAAPRPGGLEAKSLLKDLIAIPSVTPDAGDALDYVQSFLEELGFSCRRMPFADPEGDAVDNLLALWGGEARPRIAFAGHLDVVPPGDAAAWTHGPYEPRERDGALFGRGAVDMKGAIAAFLVAAADVIAHEPAGSIALILTGDEEGEAVNGTRKMVETLEAEGWPVDHILVGEPTNPRALGDMIKVGRRGSLNAKITVTGRQGHVAYPHLAANPVPPLLTLLQALQARLLDEGTEAFDPSNLEITSVDVGNPTTNVIPARAVARFNIRFNTRHTGEALKTWIEGEAAAVAKRHGVAIDCDIKVPGEPFYCEPGDFAELVRDAAAEETGLTPAFSTTGGSSDARFLHKLAPTLEFGLVGRTMHQVDEHVGLADLEALTRIYRTVLMRYFRL